MRQFVAENIQNSSNLVTLNLLIMSSVLKHCYTYLNEGFVGKIKQTNLTSTILGRSFDLKNGVNKSALRLDISMGQIGKTQKRVFTSNWLQLGTINCITLYNRKMWHWQSYWLKYCLYLVRLLSHDLRSKSFWSTRLVNDYSRSRTSATQPPWRLPFEGCRTASKSTSATARVLLFFDFLFTQQTKNI